MELVFLRFLMFGAFTWITASVAACGENSYMIFECVKEHNRRRAWHWAPNLHWDESLARRAQLNADMLEKIPDLNNHTVENGINVYRSRWLNPTCYEAVADWYSEKQQYRSRTLCSKPPAQWTRQLVEEIRHFTQVIWRNSTRVGVGRTKHFVVAMYYPPGNDFSQVSENVWC